MNINAYIPHIIAWGILALIVVALYLYHHWLENHEDHYIHLHSDPHDSAIVSTQAALARRIELVDKVKVTLLIAVIVYGLAVAGIAIYSAWTIPAS